MLPALRIKIPRFSLIFFSRRRWVVLTEAEQIQPHVFQFDLLLSERADLVEQMVLPVSDFKLLSIHTPGKHRMRLGHKQIFGVKFTEKNFFCSPLHLAVIRMAEFTRELPFKPGDTVTVDDQDARFFQRYKNWNLPGGFSGEVLSTDNGKLYAQADGKIAVLNLDREAMAVDGFYNRATSRNVRRTLERVYAASVGQVFRRICHVLERFGVHSFNRLRFCPPIQPVLERYGTLFELILLLKHHSASFFKKAKFSPKPIFTFTSPRSDP